MLDSGRERPVRNNIGLDTNLLAVGSPRRRCYRVARWNNAGVASALHGVRGATSRFGSLC